MDDCDQSLDGGPHAWSTAAERLAALILGNRVIAFELGIPDKEHPYITCSMWGSIPTNELFVCITNGDLFCVDSTKSVLDVPAMCDRTSGMEIEDADAASALADRVWKRHMHQLTRGTVT